MEGAISTGTENTEEEKQVPNLRVHIEMHLEGNRASTFSAKRKDAVEIIGEITLR